MTTLFGRGLLLLAIAAATGVEPARGADPPPQELAGTTQRALDLLRSGQRQRAAALFQEIVAIDPRHGTARMQLGLLALERGDPEAAVEHLEIATSSDPQRLYLAWALLGRAYLGTGGAEAALGAFDAALDLAPRFAPAVVGRGRSLAWLGRPEEALGALARARELAEEMPEGSLLAAQLLAALERPREALELAREVADRVDPTTTSAAAEMLRLAIEAESGSPAGAELRLALAEDLSLADGYLALAIERLRANEPRAARLLLLAALELDDTNPVPFLLLRRLTPGDEIPPPPAERGLRARLAAAAELSAAGRHEESAAIASDLLERRPHLVPARLLLLEAVRRTGKLWEALAGYRQLVAWLPGIPAVEARMADLARAMGADDLALCRLQEGLATDSGDGALRYRKAAVLADRGDSAAALEEVRRALDLGFRNARAWLLVGRLHLDRMEVAPALAAYRRALELEPDSAEAIGSFALSSLTTEQFSTLRELLEDHSVAHPDNADTFYALGVMSLREGRLEDAERYLVAVERLRPDRSEVPYNLSLVYRRQNRATDGRAALERFEALKSREAEAWLAHNRAHALRLDAEEAEETGRWTDAITAYERIVEDGTAGRRDLVALGRAYLVGGEPATAAAWFRRAASLEPYDREILAGQAEAAEAMGRADAATELRQRIELLSADCD